MACPKVAGCPLFKQFVMKSSLRIWTTNYCEGTFERCERFKRSSAGQPVAPNLLPNGRLLEAKLEDAEVEPKR